jgi:cell division protein ZapA (FtsZ GTPase activity inhibitor)
MPEKQRVDIEILGQKYPIRSDAGPEYVRQLASFVDKRARQIRGDAPGQDP